VSSRKFFYEGLLAAISLLRWKIKVSLRYGGSEDRALSSITNAQGTTIEEAEIESFIRKLLRFAPRWRKGHELLLRLAQGKGDNLLIQNCNEVLKLL
jgi:hypothetical protein